MPCQPKQKPPTCHMHEDVRVNNRTRTPRPKRCLYLVGRENSNATLPIRCNNHARAFTHFDNIYRDTPPRAPTGKYMCAEGDNMMNKINSPITDTAGEQKLSHKQHRNDPLQCRSSYNGVCTKCAAGTVLSPRGSGGVQTRQAVYNFLNRAGWHSQTGIPHARPSNTALKNKNSSAPKHQQRPGKQGKQNSEQASCASRKHLPWLYLGC
ncbi:unnamed protein product [Ectocarpus fasciculatus]